MVVIGWERRMVSVFNVPSTGLVNLNHVARSFYRNLFRLSIGKFCLLIQAAYPGINAGQCCPGVIPAQGFKFLMAQVAVRSDKAVRGLLIRQVLVRDKAPAHIALQGSFFHKSIPRGDIAAGI